DGVQLAENIRERRVATATIPTIVILCTRAITQPEERRLTALMRDGIVKVVYSLERLLDDSVLLLHRAEASLQPRQRNILEQVRQTDSALYGKTVLVVDDDVR